MKNLDLCAIGDEDEWRNLGKEPSVGDSLFPDASVQWFVLRLRLAKEEGSLLALGDIDEEIREDRFLLPPFMNLDWDLEVHALLLIPPLFEIMEEEFGLDVFLGHGSGRALLVKEKFLLRSAIYFL